MSASTITRSMADWQERITRGTHPAIRVEHDLRYRLAGPRSWAAATWSTSAAATASRPRRRSAARSGAGRARRRRRSRRSRPRRTDRRGATVALRRRPRPTATRWRASATRCSRRRAARDHLLRGRRAPADLRPAGRAADRAGRAGRGDGRAQRPQRRLLGDREPLPRDDVGRGVVRGAAPLLPEGRSSPTRSRSRARRSCPGPATASTSSGRRAARRGRGADALPRRVRPAAGAARRPPGSRRPTSTRARVGAPARGRPRLHGRAPPPRRPR